MLEVILLILACFLQHPSFLSVVKKQILVGIGADR